MKIDEIDTTNKHLKLLAKDLREPDKDEIVAKTGTSDIEKTLIQGFKLTDYCRSFFVDDEIAGVYGVVASLDDKNIRFTVFTLHTKN